MLEMVTKMLQGSPSWIWAVLGIIIFRGVRALYPRVMYLPTLFIVPIVLITLKLTYGIEEGMALYYSVGLVAGLVVGYVMVQRQKGIVINKQNMTLTVPGSPQLLILLLLFFVVRYTFGYLGAVNAEVALEYMWLENVLTGTIIGYLLGNTTSYIQRYIQA